MGIFSCNKTDTLFTKIAAENSGINFTNTITESKEQNVLMYEYYYNGNGVAVGDVNQDGLPDLFFTGNQTPSGPLSKQRQSMDFLRDYTNLDFVKYDVAGAYADAAKKSLDVSTRESYQKNIPLFDLLKKMPASKLGNYMFQNNHNLGFLNKTTPWGMDEKGVSSGAAYADLDNDGDLDMIVCNNNDPVWLYQNNANETEHNNYIKVSLKGSNKNTAGLGAKVIVYTDSGSQMQEMYPVRGYQSSVDYRLNFGLGKQQTIKQIKVYWSKESCTTIANPAINTTVIISQADSKNEGQTTSSAEKLFTDVSLTSGINFIQKENNYVDFKREFLIPFALSKQGPRMSKADVNGDGLEDVFIGAPTGQASALYIQKPDGSFTLSAKQPWQQNKIYEDVGSVFFDADKDGDADLYVVSGGNEWLSPGPGLQDRLYLNDGKGNFSNSTQALPLEVFSGSCVAAVDFDKDGDIDLFVGDRSMPGSYPLTGGNILLRNDYNAATGKVLFTNITVAAAGVPLFNAGIVTDAVWNDIDTDGWPDLIVAGDWMPVRIFHNDKGRRFIDITTQSGMANTNGWWTKILPVDVDGDGDTDLVVGNMGTNTQFKCSVTEPLTTYAADFNNDGTIDPVMTRFIQGKSYPAHSRDELIEQIPNLNKRFLKYADFGNATITDVFAQAQLEAAQKFYVYQTASMVFINNKGVFTGKALPVEAQFSCINGLSFQDYDGDGKNDLLLSGNFYPFRVQQGNNDANFGLLLRGNNKGDFKVGVLNEPGLYIPGDARDMVVLKGRTGEQVIVSKNNGGVQVIRPLKVERN